MPPFAQLSATELLAGYRARSFSPLEAVAELSARIEQLNPLLGAFTTLSLERARSEAVAATERYRRGEPLGPLDGVPLGVKDLYDSEGLRTTYGSAIFAGHLPSRDAAVVAGLRGGGAIVLGKTQTHEFAWGISSVNRALGTSRNPWDTTRLSGGSSGGSAVALAAGLVPLALGTDTGGSIRIPSAFCGTVGLKPSYGRVSTEGIFPLARSLDHAGPMARTPADVALLFAALAPDTVRSGDDPPARPGGSLTGVRVGLCPDLHPMALAPAVEAAFDRTARLAAELGGELVEIELPEAAAATATYMVIQRAEAFLAHARAGLYPARAGDYGDDVRGWLELAAGVGLADYIDASAERVRLRAGFARLFSGIDLLLTPVAACSPFLIDEERTDHLGEQASLRELVLGFTVPQNLAGLPACAFRAGFDERGCPVGVQLTGPPWGEQRLLVAVEALYAADAELQARRPDFERLVAGDAEI